MGFQAISETEKFETSEISDQLISDRRKAESYLLPEPSATKRLLSSATRRPQNEFKILSSNVSARIE